MENKYNYYEAMEADINEAIADNEYWYSGLDRDDLEEKLNDELWLDDSVTGNASGSYTFNTEEAKSYVMDNLDLYEEAVCELSGDPYREAGKVLLDNDWEAADVTIRCYILSSVISSVLDEAEEEGYFEEAEEA